MIPLSGIAATVEMDLIPLGIQYVAIVVTRGIRVAELGDASKTTKLRLFDVR